MYTLETFPNADATYLESTVDLFATGVTTEPFGWHGTNIEALYYLAKHGSLPVGGCFGSNFYFVPSVAQSEGWYEAKQTATNGAQDNIRAAYVARRLPPNSVDPKDLFFLVTDPHDGESAEETAVLNLIAKEARVTKAYIKQLRVEAASRATGAVLLGISENIHAFPTISATRGEHVVRASENGTPITCLTGIEPIDQYAWDQCIKLQGALIDGYSSRV